VVAGQRIWGPKGQGVEQAAPLQATGIYSDLFPDCQVANEIATPRVSINSIISSTDCKTTASVNRNLQPEIESSEYSSIKNLLEYFTTRVVLEYSRQPLYSWHARYKSWWMEVWREGRGEGRFVNSCGRVFVNCSHNWNKTEVKLKYSVKLFPNYFGSARTKR